VKIKTVRAARVEKALNQIMAELGPQAIVVSARRVLPAPAWQVWHQPLVELVAVLPEGRTSSHLSPDPSSERGGEVLVPGGANARSLASSPQLSGQRARGAGLDVAEKPADYAALRRELIRSLAQAAAPSTPRRDWAVHHLRRLLAQGLDAHLARRAVMAAWMEASCAEGQAGEEVLEERLTAQLHRLVRAQPPLPTAHALQPVALVGPPGAGKSTALARLALRLRGAGLRVALIAIDGGEKPSRTTDTAASPEQLQRMLAEIRAADPAQAILVDTPGCAPDDSAGLRQLAGFLGGLNVQLVLNAAAPMEALSAAALAFAPLRPAGLIWTHLDQAHGVGPVFNIAHATGLPLTYLASGPRSLTDFGPAQPALLVGRLLSSKLSKETAG